MVEHCPQMTMQKRLMTVVGNSLFICPKYHMLAMEDLE
jgi:hypothetical protein